MPVLAEAKIDHWYRVTDFEGHTGWIHQSQLKARRTVVVALDSISLFRRPDFDAPRLAVLYKAVALELIACDTHEGHAWCHVKLARQEHGTELSGYIPRGAVWGV